MTRHGRTNVSPTRSLSIPAATLVAAVLMSAALGQNASPAGGQSANQSSSAASVTNASQGTPTPTGAATSAGPSGTGSTSATGGASAAEGDKQQPVCFKLTGRCVDAASTKPAAGGARAASKPSSSTRAPLNLTAPDVRSVVPADELQKPLADSEQITEVQESETVAVKGERDAPDVPGGFGALWWALNHPSQAWRILTPVE